MRHQVRPPSPHKYRTVSRAWRRNRPPPIGLSGTKERLWGGPLLTPPCNFGNVVSPDIVRGVWSINSVSAAAVIMGAPGFPAFSGLDR